MALIEIDDQHYNTARAFQEMFDKIGKSADRTTLLKLVKKHYPETVIPELDAAAPLEKRLEEIETKISDRERQNIENNAKEAIRNFRRELRKEGWDDEGIERVEEYMRQTQNPDYKSAAAYIKSQLPNPQSIPSTFSGQRFNWFSPPTDAKTEADENHKLLMKNPRQFQDKQVQDWLSKTKGRRLEWGNQ